MFVSLMLQRSTVNVVISENDVKSYKSCALTNLFKIVGTRDFNRDSMHNVMFNLYIL